MKKKEKLNILYEDKHLIVVYKKSGLPTINSDKYGISLYSKVYDYLHKKNQKVFIVHRLDKDTCGIIVFAKSEKVKNNLQINWDSVKRNYIAVVHGKTLEKGQIKSYLKETKTLYTYSTNDKNGKLAITNYTKIKSNNNYTMLDINIETGRKNQIRVHMKDNNTPIVGDKKYGIKDGYRNMLLVANKINFIHPITRENINIDIGIPDNFNDIFRSKDEK